MAGAGVKLADQRQSLAQPQGAAGKMQATIGMEPAFSSVSTTPLDQLTREVGASMRDWNKAPQ